MVRTDAAAGRSAPLPRGGPALVLGGGGALGALQAGALKALFRAGFRPGLIVGTSVGALNGAFLAFHPDERGAERLAEIWLTFDLTKLFHRNLARMAVCVAARRFCVYDNDYLRQVIRDHLEVDDFAAAQVPLFVTATDLMTGAKAVFSQGLVSDALLASAAIPGLFGPVERGGHVLIDGAVAANLDIATAVALGADEVLAIDPSPPLARSFPRHILGVLTRSLDVLMRQQTERDIRYYGQRATLTVLRPGRALAGKLDAARRPGELIDLGEAATEALLARCIDGEGWLAPGMVEGERGTAGSREGAHARE